MLYRVEPNERHEEWFKKKFEAFNEGRGGFVCQFCGKLTTESNLNRERFSYHRTRPLEPYEYILIELSGEEAENV